MDMEALITSITALFTAAMGWVSTVLAKIVEEPVLLLMCVAVPLVGLGISFTRRLFSVN